MIAFCFVVGALRSESYNQPDELKLIHALVKGPPSGIAYSLETLTSPRAIEAEIAALMFELKKIDLKAEPHHTDGWSDFQKAEWPLMAILYTGFAIANHADSHTKFKPVAVRHINWCLDALRTNAMSGFMKPHFGEPWPARGEIATSSVFLHGHYLYLGVRLRELAGPTRQDRWSALCARALVRDFGKSWRDGNAFLGIVNSIKPGKIFKMNPKCVRSFYITICNHHQCGNKHCRRF